MDHYIGYDIGAISVNRAVINRDGDIVDVLPYTRHLGEPAKLIAADLKKLQEGSKFGQTAGIAFTGLGGKTLASVLDTEFINEIEAITTPHSYNCAIATFCSD